MAKQREATDRLGQTIKEGSIVAAPDSKTSLFIGRVIKITPKQLRLENLDNRAKGYRGSSPYKYHHEVVCLDQMQEIVMYLLKLNV